VRESKKRHSAENKAQAAIDAIRGDRSISDIAVEHGVRPSQVLLWRKQLIANAANLFQDARLGPHKDKAHVRARSEQLYREIGALAVEVARGHLHNRAIRTQTERSIESDPSEYGQIAGR
jgi:transposase-like protein